MDIIPNLPFGNGDQAEYLCALYQLTGRELTSALWKVFFTRLGIAIAVGFLVPKVSVAAAPVIGTSVAIPLIIMSLVVHTFYSMRNLASISTLLTQRMHRDLSIVLQAIKDKTGGPPPEYQQGGWVNRLGFSTPRPAFGHG